MISPTLTVALAQARVDDLRRAADAHRLARNQAQQGSPVAAKRSVTLRFGSLADQARLARLAELDSAASPAHPVLLAEVDGQLRAALALTGGAVVADPFYPTADLIDLLRARARQLDASPRIRRSRRLRSWFRRQALAWR
jgi:predicted amidohydrolase YtcJ